MSSVSSYQSLPSTSSNATVRRKPFPTALNVLNRNEAKVKHKWQAGRLVLATLETNPRPSPLEETNTAIGNKDDKWSDEYMKQMDQRVLEPMFRNCRNAFATSAKAERLGLASGDIKLTQRLDGQVGIGDDSSEEVEEKDQDSDEELAQTQAREVHFAGDQSAAQTNKNLRRGPTRVSSTDSAQTSRSNLLQASTNQSNPPSSFNSMRRRLASSDRLVEAHPEPMIEEHAGQTSTPRRRRIPCRIARPASQQQPNLTWRGPARPRNDDARIERILKITGAAMNRRSDSSKISLFPQRSVFTKTSPAYREKKPNKPANKKDGGKKKEGKDKDKKEQTKVEDGLFNALVTVFGLGVLLAVIAMVCGGMFGSASRYHS